MRSICTINKKGVLYKDRMNQRIIVSLILLFSIIVFSQSIALSQQILITEIMYDLDGTDSPNEFVEIFNPSETDSLNMDGWTIRDRSSTDALIDSGFGLKIPPLSYGLIMEGDYSFETGIYNSIIPENTVLIKVDDSSIGNGLSASDSLFLQDSTGQIMEILGWEDWVQDGFTLERLRYHLGNNPSNWAQSLDSLGTPGSVNSVLPDTIDFAIFNLTLSPSVITNVATTTLLGQVVNDGLNTAEPEVKVYVDGAYYTNEFPGNIAELDTVEFELEIGPFESGYHTILVLLSTEGDINISNNQDSVVLGVRYEFRTFVLNEFIPQPISGLPEFVEIVNMNSDTVDLKNWRITDSNEGVNYGLGSISIAMDDYVVIAADSTLVDSVPNGVPYLIPDGGFPTLNNGGDEIRIFDPFNTLIDSLTYTSNWGISQGISLEKFFADDSSHLQVNWAPSTSPAGFTIGAPNAVTPATINGTLLSNDIFYSPAIPSELDEVTITIPILNSGTSIFSGIVQVFSNNVMINQSPVNSGNMGDSVLVDVSIGTFSSGFHELSLSLIVENDEDENDNAGLDTLKIRYPFGTLLINEFMSAPNNDQSEFVELIAFEDLEMIDWGISDNHLDPVQLEPFSVSNGDFILVLSDSNMIDLVDGDAHLTMPFNFPSLNNSADGIFLFDHTGSIIDSLHYDNDWPLTSERSTEKTRPSYTSNEPLNWSLADADVSMTPGAKNSVMILDVDGMILQDAITYLPTPPFPDSVVTILIPIVNAGIESFDGTYSIEMNDDEIGDGIIPIISMGDTVMIESEIVSPSSGVNAVTIILNISDDENPENDIGVFSLNVRYPFGSVLINEFLAAPNNDQSEFVELIAFQDLELIAWGISDNVLIPIQIDSFSVENGDFLVILSDSNMIDFVNDGAHITIPSNFPGLNNSADGIYLFDHTGSVIDSLNYDGDWPVTNDRSTEKKRPSYISNISGNWSFANADVSMTPGAQNSVMILDVDGMVLQDSITYLPVPPFPDSVVTLQIPIVNAGIELFDGTFSIEMNDDEIGEGIIPTISMGDTVIIESEIVSPSSGVHSISIILNIADDGNSENNIATFPLAVRYIFGSILINEFFSRPDSTESEFVEMIPQQNVNINDWTLMDLGGTKGVFPNLDLTAFTYCLVTGDSSFLDLIPVTSILILPQGGFPGLNNTSETIYILDHTESVIDSLQYNENWPLMDSRSTEKYRINDMSNEPKNWGISVGDIGKTPGFQNSLFFSDLPSKGSVEISPDPFSPDGDGIDDELTITFSLPYLEAVIRWEIVDMAGRVIAKPYYNYQVGQNGKLTWNGHRDNGKQARIGIYVMKISFQDAVSTQSWETVKTVVLAKPL